MSEILSPDGTRGKSHKHMETFDDMNMHINNHLSGRDHVEVIQTDPRANS